MANIYGCMLGHQMNEGYDSCDFIRGDKIIKYRENKVTTCQRERERPEHCRPTQERLNNKKVIS